MKSISALSSISVSCPNMNYWYAYVKANISAYSSTLTTVSCLAVGSGGSVFKPKDGFLGPDSGGGAGGMVEVTFTMPQSSNPQSITINVGAGSTNGSGKRGGDTIVATGLTKTDGSPVENIIAIGGGGYGLVDGGSGAGSGDTIIQPYTVGLSIQQIVDIDEKTQTLVFSGWLDMVNFSSIILSFSVINNNTALTISMFFCFLGRIPFAFF